MIEDISTLQHMVRKRDDIIATLQERLDARESGEQIDYEELVLQLKAATGEITRLEEELANETHTRKQIGNEYDNLVTEFNKLEQQLDQECDTNAELEDKISDIDGTIGQITREGDIEILLRKNQVLEEKLAICDEYYNNEVRRVKGISELVSKMNYLLTIDPNQLE